MPKPETSCKTQVLALGVSHSVANPKADELWAKSPKLDRAILSILPMPQLKQESRSRHSFDSSDALT